MRPFLEYYLTRLVDHPQELRIDPVDEDGEMVFYIEANPEDIGRIIGRKGRTIHALRNVVARSAPEGQRVDVEVVTEDL